MATLENTPHSANSGGRKFRALQYVILELLTIAMFVVLFRMATHVIPGYGAMYEGMGDTIPGFIRLFLNNFMISFALVALLFGFYLLQHISFAHSFRAARIWLITSFALALLLLVFFWFVCKYPMRLIQHALDSLPT